MRRGRPAGLSYGGLGARAVELPHPYLTTTRARGTGIVYPSRGRRSLATGPPCASRRAHAW